MSSEAIEQAMARVWIDLEKDAKRNQPPLICVNGEIFDAINELKSQPEVCSPAGLATLFPALGANIRRKSSRT